MKKHFDLSAGLHEATVKSVRWKLSKSGKTTNAIVEFEDRSGRTAIAVIPQYAPRNRGVIAKMIQASNLDSTSNIDEVVLELQKLNLHVNVIHQNGYANVVDVERIAVNNVERDDDILPVDVSVQLIDISVGILESENMGEKNMKRRQQRQRIIETARNLRSELFRLSGGCAVI
jgi:hypothetical protein